MTVVFKGNYSGMILLEELEGERGAWKANECLARVLTEGMARHRGRAQIAGVQPLRHFHKYFKEKCLLLRIASMLL